MVWLVWTAGSERGGKEKTGKVRESKTVQTLIIYQVPGTTEYALLCRNAICNGKHTKRGRRRTMHGYDYMAIWLHSIQTTVYPIDSVHTSNTAREQLLCVVFRTTVIQYYCRVLSVVYTGSSSISINSGYSVFCPRERGCFFCKRYVYQRLVHIWNNNKNTPSLPPYVRLFLAPVHCCCSSGQNTLYEHGIKGLLSGIHISQVVHSAVDTVRNEVLTAVLRSIPVPRSAYNTWYTQWSTHQVVFCLYSVADTYTWLVIEPCRLCIMYTVL